MTNKEFLLKLVEARTPIWLDWEDNNTVIIGDPDDVSYKSKVVFDGDGNAISVEKVLERWEIKENIIASGLPAWVFGVEEKENETEID